MFWGEEDTYQFPTHTSISSAQCQITPFRPDTLLYKHGKRLSFSIFWDLHHDAFLSWSKTVSVQWTIKNSWPPEATVSIQWPSLDLPKEESSCKVDDIKNWSLKLKPITSLDQQQLIYYQSFLYVNWPLLRLKHHALKHLSQTMYSRSSDSTNKVHLSIKDTLLLPHSNTSAHYLTSEQRTPPRPLYKGQFEWSQGHGSCTER